MSDSLLSSLSRTRPVLIAGATASGKSALALRIAQAQGGVIVNADALQVYANWSILTARPGSDDLARAPHALYGHVARDAPYSAGHWLREVAALLKGDARPIIVGGTGLYFRALTEGLAEIPETPPAIRAQADRLSLDTLRARLDAATAARIDLQNRARVQRAWEVQQATGTPLAAWQDATPAPLLPLAEAQPVLVHVDRQAHLERIAGRFEAMLAAGALDEVRANFEGFDPARPADKAIGAAPLVAHLRGETKLAEAREKAIVATRQYAKRQRTWFRARMKNWHPLEIAVGR